MGLRGGATGPVIVPLGPFVGADTVPDLVSKYWRAWSQPGQKQVAYK
jgi:hypothetical protein